MFYCVNNWKILTLKVYYEFLVVIMVWRSDLFNILTCSALSSWRLMLYITGLIKHCWKVWGQSLCMGISHSHGFKKALSEFFFCCCSQLIISTDRRRKNIFYPDTFLEADSIRGWEQFPIWTRLSPFSCAVALKYWELCLQTTLSVSYSCLFPQWTCVRKLVAWKYLE